MIRKGRKHGFEGPSAVHDAIRELKDHKSTSSEELARRAGHLKTLTEMAQIMRALMIRAQTGKLSQSALDSTAPPKVKPLAPRGTEDAFEYVRTTLQMMRPIIVKLYVENHSLTKRVQSMEAELSVSSGADRETPKSYSNEPLTLTQLSQVLGAMGLCDSEMEDTLDEPEELGVAGKETASP